MIIICSICAHELTKSETVGHLAGEALGFYKSYLHTHAAAQKLSIQNSATTRSMMTNIVDSLTHAMVGFVNQQKIECATCHIFTKWTTSQVRTMRDVTVAIPAKEECL